LASAESIAHNGAVLSKIYVPPQIFPIATSIAGLLNFFIGMIPLALVCAISGQRLSWKFPLVVLVGFCLALLVAGIGLVLSILFIRFDDTRNIVNVLLMILIYITPVFYPLTILGPRLQVIIQLNPLTSYLDIFRWAFSNNAVVNWVDWVYMFSTSLISIAVGSRLFRKYWPRTVAML
jgi:ABC-type polysaccharide/polyol phosphate export permease